MKFLLVISVLLALSGCETLMGQTEWQQQWLRDHANDPPPPVYQYQPPQLAPIGGGSQNCTSTIYGNTVQTRCR